jgi:hypothetical protein
MNDLLEYDVIIGDDVELEHYDRLLKKFPQWKQYKREIKLNILLNEGKRIVFDVTEISKINSPIYGSLGKPKDFDISLKRISFFVRSMSFIIKGNKVDGLKVRLKVLDNTPGKELLSILDSGCVLEVKQLRLPDKSVTQFYFDIPNNDLIQLNVA